MAVSTVDHYGSLGWSGGRITGSDLGPLDSDAVVRGSDLLWSNAATLNRRDLDTDDTGCHLDERREH